MPGPEFMERVNALDPKLRAELDDASMALDKALDRGDGPATKQAGAWYDAVLSRAIGLVTGGWRLVVVEWDYDDLQGDEGSLPSDHQRVPNYIRPEAVADFLSDEHGWLVKSWEDAEEEDDDDPSGEEDNERAWSRAMSDPEGGW